MTTTNGSAPHIVPTPDLPTLDPARWVTLAIVLMSAFIVVLDNTVLNVAIPFPLPVVGQKVKVNGKYGISGRNSGDMVSDPMNGVMMQKKIEVIEPVTDKAQFAKKI